MRTIPQLRDIRRLDLRYIGRVDCSQFDYFIPSADSLQCLNLRDLCGLRNVEKLVDFKNLQQLHISSPVDGKAKAVETVLLSLPGLRSLTLNTIGVGSLYSMD